jgi:hypothetical protein
MTLTLKKKSIWLLLSLLAFSVTLSASAFDNTVVKLNPDYKLKRTVNNTIVMVAQVDGITIKHEFKDMYADLLLAAYRKQRLGYIMENLSKKYFYSDEQCRREIKHALNVLSEWNIVLRDEKLASL